MTVVMTQGCCVIIHASIVHVISVCRLGCVTFGYGLSHMLGTVHWSHCKDFYYALGFKLLSMPGLLSLAFCRAVLYVWACGAIGLG